MFDTVLRARNAVVQGGVTSVAVGIANGRIAALEPVDSELPTADDRMLEPGQVLLPGLVDTHVHVNEPGRTDWEGFDSATRAAAAGGVTTIVDMPLNSIPATTTVAALAAKQEHARGRSHVNVGFWGGAVPGNDRDLAPLVAAGVLGFKCFLVDSGVPEFAPLSTVELRTAMRTVAGLGSLLVVHAEDPAAIAAAPPAHGRKYDEFLRSRPDHAETRAVSEVIAAAAQTGARAHVVHLSSASAVAVLRSARARGVDVTSETCPHYLVLDAAAVPDGATQFKCCPPIRGKADQDALWRGLGDGDIDMVVTDHSPCTVDLKQAGGGDFAVAWGGIASLQLGLPLVWTAAAERGFGLVDVVRWMAETPAHRVGLHHKGRIALGADADFCIFRPDADFRVDPARLLHRHPLTPYAGRRLTGLVDATWLSGAPLAVGDSPRGELLRG